MGRRSKKRRTIKRIHWRDRKPPTTFQCPECGSISISVKIQVDEEQDKRIAYISCGNPSCRLRSIVRDIPSIWQPVDVYSRFIDLYSEGKADIWYEESETEEAEEGVA
jgi:transcription elongation factor Elf1